MQQLELVNSNLGEINFIGKMMRRDDPQRLKMLIKIEVHFP
jgi:ribosomal 50S subunit-associated protein YjgA (DUF615 family)